MGKLRDKATKSSKRKSKNFASFDLTQAFKQLGVKHLLNWELEVQPMSSLQKSCQFLGQENFSSNKV